MSPVPYVPAMFLQYPTYILKAVDPYDWKVKDKDKVVEHILSHVQDGDIVLMHDIYQPTAEAVAEGSTDHPIIGFPSAFKVSCTFSFFAP